MDTDGTLGIYYKVDSGYQASVEFYNDDKHLMEWVVSMFGGTYRAKKDLHRDAVGYRWTPTGRQHAISFLNGILPYLILKRKEADLLLKFYGIVGENPDLRKELTLKCRLEKGRRSIVETDMLGALLKESPKLVRAYIAGLLDGDGNIDVYENHIVIGFTNMSVGLVEFLKEHIGGNYYRCKPTTVRWQLSGARIQEKFLLSIVPYLVSKRSRCITAIEKLRFMISRPRIMGRPFDEVVIQSELIGDNESDLAETLES